MAEFRDRQPLSYDVDPSFGDFIIEEGANSSVNMRRISWNGRPYKLDIRKYAYKDGAESPMKGVTLTDDGAHELTSVLIEQGFGSTKRIMKTLREREDFDPAMIEDDYDFTEGPKANEDEYFDPQQLLGDSSTPQDSILLSSKSTRKKKKEATDECASITMEF